jgi:hypothetical protein
VAQLSQALGLAQTVFRFAGPHRQSTGHHLAKALNQIAPLEDCAVAMVVSISAMAKSPPFWFRPNNLIHVPGPTEQLRTQRA